MGKAKRDKKAKRRVKELKPVLRTVIGHPNPNSPEEKRFRELNTQYERDNEFDLTPEDYKRDLGIIVTPLFRAMSSHLQLIVPDILKEHFGFDPPTEAVDTMCYALEEIGARNLDDDFQVSEDLQQAFFTILQYLKFALINAEILAKVKSEFIPSDIRERFRALADKEREQSQGVTVH